MLHNRNEQNQAKLLYAKLYYINPRVIRQVSNFCYRIVNLFHFCLSTEKFLRAHFTP